MHDSVSVNQDVPLKVLLHEERLTRRVDSLNETGSQGCQISGSLAGKVIDEREGHSRLWVGKKATAYEYKREIRILDLKKKERLGQGCKICRSLARNVVNKS